MAQSRPERTPSFAEEQMNQIRDAYDTWVRVIDRLLEPFDPKHDDVPDAAKAAMGWVKGQHEVKVVRYRLLAPPAGGTGISPYGSLLEKTKMINVSSLNEVGAPAEAATREARFISVVPPEPLDVNTLMALTLEAEDPSLPELPAAVIRQPDPNNRLGPSPAGPPVRERLHSTPFDSPDLTNRLQHLAVTIQRMQDSHSLAIVPFKDVQAA